MIRSDLPVRGRDCSFRALSRGHDGKPETGENNTETVGRKLNARITERARAEKSFGKKAFDPVRFIVTVSVYSHPAPSPCFFGTCFYLHSPHTAGRGKRSPRRDLKRRASVFPRPVNDRTAAPTTTRLSAGSCRIIYGVSRRRRRRRGPVRKLRPPPRARQTSDTNRPAPRRYDVVLPLCVF